MYKQQYFIYFIFILSLCACKENRHLQGKVDKTINIELVKFYEDINALKSPDNICDEQCLSQKYGEFYSIYNQGVLRIGPYSAPEYKSKIKRFLNDSIYIEVYDSINKYYVNTEIENAKLTEAFRNYKLLFPGIKIPACYTHISGFNEPIVVSDSVLSISLENYLGEEHVFYKRLGVYKYQRPKKNREYMIADAMHGWITSDFQNPTKKSNLLSQIIHEGKILYILESIMPKEDKHLLINLTKYNYEWCKASEPSLWKFMIEKKHLFSNHQVTISKYMNDGPFFNFLGANTSPMVGKFIGWQIIRSYMDKNKDISIEELLKNTDAQDILQKSYYKPA